MRGGVSVGGLLPLGLPLRRWLSPFLQGSLLLLCFSSSFLLLGLLLLRVVSVGCWALFCCHDDAVSKSKRAQSRSFQHPRLTELLKPTTSTDTPAMFTSHTTPSQKQSGRDPQGPSSPALKRMACRRMKRWLTPAYKVSKSKVIPFATVCFEDSL